MGLSNPRNSLFVETTPLRFISASVFLHATLLASVALMNVPPLEFPKKEVIEFEVESTSVAKLAIPDGVPQPETMGAAAPVAKPASMPIAVPSTSAPMVAAAPATLGDIQAPDLETASSPEDVAVVARLDEKDLQEDFEKVDQAQHKALVVAKNSLDEDANKAAAEGNEALSEIEKETQQELQAQAEATEKRRAQDAAVIAAAQISEKAAAEKAARRATKEAAAREAREAQLAAAREDKVAREGEEAAARLAALKASSSNEGQGTADDGEGTGGKGSPEGTKEVAGIPGGVRSLEQLRQMSGNKFPQYDNPERLARQEGQVIFYAYVSKNGTLSNFKLGESSGYRNLDAKTLAALKKWKFYPGQEGWVEMPFKWTLAGEAMQAGGQLRK